MSLSIEERVQKIMSERELEIKELMCFAVIGVVRLPEWKSQFPTPRSAPLGDGRSFYRTDVV